MTLRSTNVGVWVMPSFTCKGCGQLVHLGPCDQQPDMTPRADYRIDRLPTGELVIKLNGVTVATGFDDHNEAQEWIDDQC